MHNKFEVNNFMKKLKTLYFEDFVDFACEASDMYDSINDDLILSILVYTFFSRMFDLMLPPVAKHSIVVA